jgi:hypothetical protein
MKNAFLTFVALFLVSIPFFASAESSFDAACMVKGGCWGPLITCTGDYTGVVTHTAQVPDPANPGQTKPIGTCTSVCDLAVLLNTWIFFAYTIIVYVLLPLGVAIGGFIWLTSAGNEERVSMARGIFGTTFKGLAIASVVVLVVGFVISSIGIGASNDSATKGGSGLGMSIVCNPNSDTIKVLNPDLNIQPANPT